MDSAWKLLLYPPPLAWSTLSTWLFLTPVFYNNVIIISKTLLLVLIVVLAN